MRFSRFATLAPAQERDGFLCERALHGGYAEYDFRRLKFAIGMDFKLHEALTGSIAVRQVSGSADVSSPVGGGTIDATGKGLSAGLSWEGPDGLYGNGRLSATWYDVGVASDSRGNLKAGIDASIHTLDVEAGRRFALGEKTGLTVRTWLHRSEASVARFTDVVRSRVSVIDAEHLKGAIGGIVETDLDWRPSGKTLSLHGSLDLEQTLSGGETAVLVSGAELRSKSPDTRILLGVGGTYRWDRVTLQGGLRMHGVGSDDVEYSGSLVLRMAF